MTKRCASRPHIMMVCFCKPCSRRWLQAHVRCDPLPSLRSPHRAASCRCGECHAVCESLPWAPGLTPPHHALSHGPAQSSLRDTQPRLRGLSTAWHVMGCLSANDRWCCSGPSHLAGVPCDVPWPADQTLSGAARQPAGAHTPNQSHAFHTPLQRL